MSLKKLKFAKFYVHCARQFLLLKVGSSHHAEKPVLGLNS